MLKTVHSLLRRQLIRFFGQAENIPEDMRGFVVAVNDAYRQFDDDRSMLERSLEMSSQELLQANSDMRAVFQVLPDLFFRLDNEGTILDYKAGSKTDFYADPKSLLGKHIQDIPAPGVGTIFDKAIQKLKHAKSQVVTEYSLQIQNRTIFYEARFLPLPDNEIITIIRDITERKETEKELRDREGLLSATLESTADGILVVDETGVVTHSNARFVDIWHIPLDIMKSKNDDKMLEFVLEQLIDPEAFISKVRALYNSTDNSFDSLNFKDGRVFERYSCPLISGGENLGRVWSFRDITEQKKSEEALRSSEERFRLLVENLGEGILIADANENFIYINPAAEKIFGVLKNQIDGLNFLDFIPNDQKSVVRSHIESRRNKMTTTYETDILRNDGSLRSLIMTGSPLWGPDNQLKATLGVMRDITENKKAEVLKHELEEKLDKAQRMESLGLLAGGVAHDLNNILGPILGYSELLMRELPNDSNATARAKKITKSVEDAAAVIQDLLTLARRGRYEMKPLNINQIINAYLESAGFENLKDRNPNVNISVNLSSSISLILGSKVHLMKLIMNLVTNAFEAMPTGGTLFVNTEQSHIGRLYSGYQNIDEGDFVIIHIKDTGEGIAEEDKEKIFEPYFSTKKMGRSGSGLGLSVAYGVVKDHRGQYDVLSKMGAGTEFVLYFPVCEGNLEVIEAPQTKMVGGSEAVLIVDDSLDQREMASEIISSLGYTVYLAENGHQALELISHTRMDIVVLDMIMEPNFDGLDTYKEMLKIAPNQKAIVVSGFSETDRVQEMLKLGAGYYIKKPYNIAHLAKALRDELSKSSNPVSLAIM